jgi:hypothetical protein
MRRLLATVAIIALSLPLAAQMRSGGHATVSSRGGFGGRVAFGNRSPAFGFHGNRGFPFRPFPGRFVPRPFFPGRFHHHRGFFFAGSFGFSSFASPFWYGYPGLYPAYSYPLVAYSNSAESYYPSPDIPYPLDNSYFANAEDQRRIEDRLDRLEDRMNRFLDEQYEKSNPPTATRREPKAEPNPATILVFRDKHTEAVNNYAVIGGTVWIFTEERAKKVPLRDLDLEATARQNEARGVEFQVAK